MWAINHNHSAEEITKSLKMRRRARLDTVLGESGRAAAAPTPRAAHGRRNRL
jgi:hypothetical protein